MLTNATIKEEMNYRANCRKIAKNLLENENYKHVIYGIGDEFTDWENEMFKFNDDKSFNDYVDEVVREFGDLTIYAVHA